jgi:hypothetical protein
MGIEPATGLTILAAAWGSKELVVKLLGPTADYLGGGMRDWTERGVQNMGRVFENARKKLGDRIETPGAVPPKVLKGIISEAPFCDDELAAEYFGGVLASSRSGVSRDDRGAAFAALVGRLSAYQIRAHYFFYSVIRILYEGATENIGAQQGRLRLKTFIPIAAFGTAMEFGPGERLEVLLGHVMFGLVRETLIDNSFAFGPPNEIQMLYPQAGEPGLVISPSPLGVELFLWAHGRGDLAANAILNAAIELRAETKMNTSPGCRSVNFPERTYPKSLSGTPVS